MAIDTKFVSTAYMDALKRAAGSGSPGTAASPADGAAGGPSFAETLEQAGSAVMQAGRTGETSVIQAAASQGELVDVVTAVANAEVTLQTVVAVRDRVVRAYQDIIKMPI